MAQLRERVQEAVAIMECRMVLEGLCAAKAAVAPTSTTGSTTGSGSSPGSGPRSSRWSG